MTEPPSSQEVKRLMLIIHGARAEHPALRHLISWVRAKGHTLEPRVTWEAGDATRFAREGAAAGMTAVIAAGGDGTVNEVVNGLAGTGTPLGIIPLGTANDFARQVGIPVDDPDHAMDVILQRKPVLVDTGELNGRHFLNVSSAGVGAEATAETPADAKAALGPLAYAITGARKIGSFAAHRARFTGPGFELETSFLLFAVGNGRATGNGALIAPRARLTDGLLDLCVVEEMPMHAFARIVLKLRKGEHLEDDGVRYHQLASLSVRSTEPISVNLDGESLEARELDYRVHRGSLQVHLNQMPGDDREG
ncbi:MAG: YegS/Rv2252/BmrU family lipid kinase [Gemmatimonadaceae bacterium]